MVLIFPFWPFQWVPIDDAVQRKGFLTSQFIKDPQGDELLVSSGEILLAVIEKRMACHGKPVPWECVAAKVRSGKRPVKLAPC